MQSVEMLSSILAGNGMPQTSGSNALPEIRMTQGAMAPELRPSPNVELLAEILARDGEQTQTTQNQQMDQEPDETWEQNESNQDSIETSDKIPQEDKVIVDLLSKQGIQ